LGHATRPAALRRARLGLVPGPGGQNSVASAPQCTSEFVGYVSAEMVATGGFDGRVHWPFDLPADWVRCAERRISVEMGLAGCRLRLSFRPQRKPTDSIGIRRLTRSRGRSRGIADCWRWSSKVFADVRS